jgi:hypothetical protein
MRATDGMMIHDDTEASPHIWTMPAQTNPTILKKTRKNLMLILDLSAGISR